MTTPANQPPGLAERLHALLPAAFATAFGGSFTVTAASEEAWETALMELGGQRRVHLEFELSDRAGRSPAVLVLTAAAAATLFGLESIAVEELATEQQLRALGELTEGGEALANAIAPLLTEMIPGLAIAIAGASLEEAETSPAAVAAALATETIRAALLQLDRDDGLSVTLALCCAPEAAALLCGATDATTGDQAAERAAKLAARAAQRAPEGTPGPDMRETVGAGATARTGSAAAATAGTVTAHPFVFGQIEPGPQPAAASGRNIDPLLDVLLQVRVELGSTEMTVEEVLGLTVGSVVELDRLAGEPVDIVVNNRLLARGEVVVVEENFGVRITEIVATRMPRSA